KEPTQKISNNSPIAWAAIEDQFFASILTPDTPGVGFVTRRLEFPPLEGTTRPALGMTAAAGFDLAPLAANAQSKVGMNLYVGPKEFERLSNQDVFKIDQEKVMRFNSFFGIFSRILLMMMSKVHHWVGNWGWAIVITTLFLRIVFIPFTFAASKSSKRMQAIQPQLKELREKYKDNPAKLNQATMALFKENRVNPAGGCLPMLVTIPFFWGFYDMLRHTSELRFAEFLWCRDLSAPDTIAHVALPVLGNVAINIFPVLLVVAMFFQMQFTPQPSVDNQQAKLMKYMPVGMGLLYYNFSSALSVYSTVNALFMMGQQFIINRMKDAPAPAPAAKSGPGGRPIKNVTPSARKK
ncbi:MAG TPA: YidC/Oxa1 family insertase periplasmic-domain containing protein, partial [Opitutaceae bacterium]